MLPRVKGNTNKKCIEKIELQRDFVAGGFKIVFQ